MKSGPALLLALGAKKGPPSDEGDDEESPPSEKAEESSARTYAREMYAALKDGDEDGFIEAALGLKKCMSEGDDEG